MSASQARLLTLTNRLHDIEYKAQNIQAQKLALATQQDALYQEYCDALDAQNIMVARFDDAGNKSFVKASYASACTYNPDQKVQFALKDTNSGKMLVDSETKAMWDKYGNDPYSFAWAMVGFDGSFAWANFNGADNEEGTVYTLDPDIEAELGKYVGLNIPGKSFEDTDGIDKYIEATDPGSPTTNYNVYMTQVEYQAYQQIIANGGTAATELEAAYTDLLKAVDENKPQDEIQQYFDKFREELYSPGNRSVIFNLMNDSKNHAYDGTLGEPIYKDAQWEDFADEFKYYENLWEAINSAGGCVELEATQQGGESGEDWFQHAVESGNAVIMQYTSGGSKQGWSETSVATNTNSGYLKSQEDDTELKKAEAKYEHELKKINKKDANYDTELSKLETERTAITTEMDSIKSVEKDNIDRTFNVFN